MLPEPLQHLGVQEQAHRQPVGRLGDQQLLVGLRRRDTRLQRRGAPRVGDQEVVHVVLDRRVIEVGEQRLQLTEQ